MECLPCGRPVAVGLFLVLLVSSPGFAVNVTWIGGTPGSETSWNTGTNWVGGSLPAGPDVAVFDATSTWNCVIDVLVNINGITINGFAGAVSQNPGNTVTLGANGLTLVTGSFNASSSAVSLTGSLLVSGGTFTGSTGSVTVSGNVTLSSGTLVAPTGTFSVNGNWATTGGTFTPGAGTVTFTRSGGGAQTLDTGGQSFRNVSHTGTQTLQLITNPLIATGTLSQSAGTFAANALAVTVTGLTTVSGGTYQASTATQTFTGGLTVSAGTFTGSTGAVVVPGAVNISGGTFTAPGAAGSLTVTGSWTEAAGATFDANGGTVTFDLGAGTQTLNHADVGGQSLNNVSHTGAGILQRTAALNLLGTFTNSGGNFSATAGTFTAAGLVTFSAGTYQAATLGQTLSGGLTISGTGAFTVTSGAVTVSNLTLTAGTFTGSTGTLTVTNLTLTAGTFTAPTGTFTVNGNWTRTGSTYNHSNATVTFASAAAATIAGNTTFYNFTCTTAGKQINFTAGSTQTVANTLTLTGSSASAILLRSTAAGSKWSLSVTAATQIATYVDVQDSDALTNQIEVSFGTNSGNNNANWVFFATRFWIGGAGNWSNTAEWSATSGGAGGASVPDAATTVVFDVNSNPGAVTVDVAINIRGISIPNGADNMTINQGASTISVGVAGWSQADAGLAFTGGTAAITITGDVVISAGTFLSTSGTLTLARNFNPTGGTFTHNGGAAVFDGTTTLLGATTFNHVTINAGRTLSGGTVTTTVEGNWSNAGTFTTATSTVTFSRTGGTQTVDNGGSSFRILNHNDTSTLQLLNNVTTTSTVTQSSTGTFDANGFTVTTGGLMTVSGGTYLARTALQTFTGLTMTGGTFTCASGNVQVTGTLTMNGAAALFSCSTGNVTATANLTITNGTFTGSTGNVTVTGVVSQTGGTLTAPSTGTFSVGGNWSRTAGTFNHNGGTVTFTSAATQTLTTTQSLNSISHTGTGTLQFITTTLTMAGSLTNSAGTVDGGSVAVVVGGDVTLSGGTLRAPGSGLSVAGNWTRTAGTFNQRMGTVTFTAGASTIAGNTTFYNLTCTTAGKAINFTSGTTQTVQKTLNFTGVFGNPILLRSTSLGVKWSIDVTSGPQAVLYVDVRDSDALTNTITADEGVDSGNNNANLIFGTSNRYWVGGNGIWSDVNEWATTSGGLPPASVPGATDVAIFDGTSGGGTCTVGAPISVRGIVQLAGTTTITQRGLRPQPKP